MKVDFHVLETANNRQQSWLYACQLIEKAYAAQKRVYVHTHSREEAERLDALLWTYREDSFIPHNLYQPTDEHAPLVQIGYASAPATHKDLLINLSQAIPSFYAQFEHTIEIVFSEPSVQQLARERFKQYREQGCQIQTYKM